MDLVTIVVPVYNVEKYIPRCIESIINQSYAKLEIIIVDDGSLDGSSRICDQYAKNDSRVRVIHQNNQGLSGARNTGIRESHGKYIVFIDSDDSVEKDYIQKLHNLVKKYGVTISVCGRYYEYEDGTKKCKYSDRFEKKYELEDAIEEMNRYYYYDMSAHGKMFHKKLFQDILFPINKLSEDYFIMYKLFRKAKRIAYTSEPLYNYLMRNNSISKSDNISTFFIDAAREQMVNLEGISDKMKVITHIAYVSSYLTIIDLYIKRKIKCPKQLIRQAKKAIVDNKGYIKAYKTLPRSKKIQIYLFKINYTIYKVAFILFRNFSGVRV